MSTEVNVGRIVQSTNVYHRNGACDEDETDKPLLLAAIDALGNIRPQEASEILDNLIDSHDEDITEAVYDALAMTEELSEDEDYNDDDDLLH